jgi:hypothetical protein
MTSVAEELIRGDSIPIIELLNDNDRSGLVLRPRQPHRY